MNRQVFLLAAVGAALLIAGVGCSRKTADTKSQIDQATQAMAQAASPQPVASAAPNNASPSSPAGQMNDALASYHNGNYEDAVTRFQNLRSQTAVTPEQLMALNKAMAAVMADLYDRAAKGDARAKAAIAAYQQLQNQRHP